jgi:hypothetical protein
VVEEVREEVADVVEGHDDHDQPADEVDRFEPVGPGRRFGGRNGHGYFSKNGKSLRVSAAVGRLPYSQTSNASTYFTFAADSGE